MKKALCLLCKKNVRVGNSILSCHFVCYHWNELEKDAKQSVNIEMSLKKKDETFCKQNNLGFGTVPVININVLTRRQKTFRESSCVDTNHST